MNPINSRPTATDPGLSTVQNRPKLVRCRPHTEGAARPSARRVFAHPAVILLWLAAAVHPIAVAVGAPVPTAPGSVDPTFDPTANGTLVGLVGSMPYVQTVLPQPDGKVLFAGWFNGVDGTRRPNVARLNADGTLDTTFHTGLGPDGEVSDLARQPDGKVLIFGGFQSVDGHTRPWLARLDADGSFDPSFQCQLSGGPNFGLAGVAVQQSGQIWIGGQFTTVNGTRRLNLARLNPDGSVDQSFDPETSISGTHVYVARIALQADDKLLVAGAWGSPGRTLIRLNVNGTIDGGFTSVLVGHALSGDIRDLACNANGTIAIVGYFTSVNGVPRAYVAKLRSDGNVDPGFNPGTGPDYNFLASVTIQPDDKIVVGGNFHAFSSVIRVGLARLNVDGRVDMTFDPGDAVGLNAGYYPHIVDLAVAPDGDIFAASAAWWTTENRDSLLRLGATGQRDPAFSPLLQAPPGAIGKLALQSDGKVIYATGNPSSLGRLNPDGRIDDSFEGGVTSGSVFAVLVQPDDKILVATTPSGEPQRGLVIRLLPDGSPDPEFLAPVIDGGEAPIEALALQPDGRILVGGLVWSTEGRPHQGIIRLHSSGEFDESFKPVPIAVTDDPGYGVEHIFVRPDGKIFIAGGFTRPDSGNAGLLLLEPDGTIDESFARNVGQVVYLYSAARQPNNKFLVAAYTGNWPPEVFQLNPDGTRDSGFQPAVDGEFGSMAIQADGQILLGSSDRMIRLNANGSVDSSFNVQLYPGELREMLLQPDGRILISGGFQSVNGVVRSGIARLYNEIKWRLDVEPFGDGPVRLQISGRPDVRLWIEASSDLGTWMKIGEVTTAMEPSTVEDPDARNFGQRFYRARTAD